MKECTVQIHAQLIKTLKVCSPQEFSQQYMQARSAHTHTHTHTQIGEYLLAECFIELLVQPPGLWTMHGHLEGQLSHTDEF